MSKKQKTRGKRAQAFSGQFIDLFAGCGGLSLGLMAAGWEGLFAVEQDSFAFDSLRHNLIEPTNSSPYKYKWPSWLTASPIEITKFIEEHADDLQKLRGKLDLLAGGPPCQGFSLAGKRKKNDPRNGLFRHYVKLVELLQPSFVLLENVKGISVAFKQSRDKKSGRKSKAIKATKPFSDRIKRSLEEAGYTVFGRHVRGMDLGVPQFRPRYIMLAIRDELLEDQPDFDPFKNYAQRRKKFLLAKKLPVKRPVTVRQAISDLTVDGKTLIDCTDSPGYKQLKYEKPKTHFQRLMHGSLNGHSPDSMRLIKHLPETAKRFEKIISSCRQGVQLNETDRNRFGLNKQCTTPLHADKPSHTLTTLPDDFLHYSEPRILTVREYARIQTFPDWYTFRGKYSTGGDRRLRECPRYTQVANAVPPFLAEFLGTLMKDLRKKLCANRR